MDDNFADLVDEAVKSIPEEFLSKLENVEILIEDWPSAYQIHKVKKKGIGGMLLGLYEGVPQTKRRSYGVGGTLPDKITIFRMPILRISRSQNDIKKLVQETVIHEIAHHFGMSEKEIRDTGN